MQKQVSKRRQSILLRVSHSTTLFVSVTTTKKTPRLERLVCYVQDLVRPLPRMRTSRFLVGLSRTVSVLHGCKHVSLCTFPSGPFLRLVISCVLERSRSRKVSLHHICQTAGSSSLIRLKIARRAANSLSGSSCPYKVLQHHEK